MSIDSAINARNNAITSLTPTFSFSLLLDPYFQQDPLTQNWYGDNKYMYDNWKNQRGAFSLTLSLPISTLFPFGTEQMNIVNKQYSIETSKISDQKTRENLEIQVKKLVKDLKKNNNTIIAYRKNLSLADRAYSMAEESYKVGSLLLIDVQTQENKLSNAKFNLLNAEYSYTSSLLDLENVLNTQLH
jgi:outer membrane protein TolC